MSDYKDNDIIIPPGEEDYSYLYEAEINVLGSIMEDKSIMEDMPLSKESFSPEWSNGRIFEVLQYAYEEFKKEQNPFDLLLMAKHWGGELRDIGGIPHLVEIARAGITAKNMIKHYTQVVNEAHVEREVQKVAQEMATGKMSIDAIKKKTERLESIRDKTANDSSVIPMGEMLEQHTKILFKRSQVKGGITGAKSFSNGINKITKGYQDGDLTITGARPSVGKTAWLTNEAMAISADGTAVAIFSGEDGAMNLFERTIARTGRIPLAHMKSGQMSDKDWADYTMAGRIIGDRNIFIDDTPSPTIESIKRKAFKLVKQYPKMAILVDYLQHLKSEKNFSSERELYKYISYELKQIARILDIPVISLAAVKRDVDTRTDKRPLLSDVRDCGNIESDADVLMFLYRDDYYDANHSRKGLMDIIIAKGRNVGTGTVTVVFDKQCQALFDMTEEEKKSRRDKGLSGS